MKFLIFVFLLTNVYAKEVTWEILQELKITKKDEKVTNTTIGKKLKPVLGKTINIKGFMLPLDFEAKKISEFLLVPYVPSCMHVPPPPANQVIHVKMKKGKKTTPSYYPVDVKGTLSVKASKTEFMESTFFMEADSIKELK